VASGPDKAMTCRYWAAFTKACLSRGLVPLVLGNRIHVAPPHVNDSDAATGLAILDEALAEADTFLT
jgi:taurine--2-oxoglutarate transaminase